MPKARERCSRMKRPSKDIVGQETESAEVGNEITDIKDGVGFAEQDGSRGY